MLRQEISEGHMDDRTDGQTNVSRAPAEWGSNKMNKRIIQLMKSEHMMYIKNSSDTSEKHQNA